MENSLHLVGSREGLVITHCVEKLEEFCLNDAYPYYDIVGFEHAHDLETLHPALLRAVNSAMRARSKVSAWAPFLSVPIPSLAAIPLDVDLVDANDQEYFYIRELVRDCFRALTSAKYITDMAASKMLHLKRPRLIPISDSYVREALDIANPSTKLHPWRIEFCSARAVSVMDALRDVGRANARSLDEFQESLGHGTEPVTVSKARILDILLWVEMAIGRHSRWTPLAAQEGWTSVFPILASANV